MCEWSMLILPEHTFQRNTKDLPKAIQILSLLILIILLRERNVVTVAMESVHDVSM
jgi:hypothetical protein